MKTCHSAGYFKQLILFLLLSLMTVFVLSGNALALTGNKIDNCADCHGNRSTGDVRPQDQGATYRNITTGAFVGSHNTHMASNATVGSCDRCHTKNTTMGHRDGKIGFTTPSINNSPNAAAYLKAGGAAFVNQTSNPDMTNAKCSNVNCHFESTTPSWGQTAAQAGFNCDSCHNSGVKSPTHTKHEQKYGTVGASYLDSCTKCHPNRATFTHATSAGDRVIAVISGVNYSGGNNKYLPNETGRTFGNCTNLYCHSSGQSATGTATPVYPSTPPNWGTASTGACGTCHATTTLSSGSHTKHFTGMSPNTNCGNCHVGATAAAYNSTLHVDTFINVTGAYSQGKSHPAGNGYGYCSAATCHDNGKGVKVQTPTWGNAAPGCSACHATSPTTDSHPKHLTGTQYAKANCGQCHTGATEGSAAGANHLNNAVDVIGYSPTSHPIGGAFQTCATTYCHSSGQSLTGTATPVYASTPPTWGGTAACGSCHATTTLSSGSHTKHFTGISPNTNCGNCHAGSTTAAYNSTRHVDTFINVTGVYSQGKSHPAGNGYGYCSTTSCHDNGKGVKVQTPTWGNSAPACGACHAVIPGDSHTKHVSGLAGKYIANAVCADCHTGYVQGTTAAVNHLNGTVEVNAGSYPSPKNPGIAFAACTNTYCHSNGKSSFASVTWGQTNLNCKSCHPTLGGAHNRHMGGFDGTNAMDWANLPFYQYTSVKSAGADSTATANYAFGCASCHPVSASSHMNGTIEVTIDAVAGAGSLRQKNATTNPGFAGTTVGTNTLKCANVYCHSDGKGGQTTTLAWSANYSAVDRCAQCHGNSPSGIGAHAAHVVGIHADDIFNGTSGKLLAGTTGSVSHGVATQVTTLNCDICHNVTVTYPRNRMNSSCSTASCHPTATDTASTQNARIGNLGKHVNGYTEVQFANIQFKSKAQLRPGSFVNYTGGVAGWKRNQVATVDQYKTDQNAYDYSKNPLYGTATFTPGGGAGQGSCANVVCHNMKTGQTVQWNTTLSCENCHSNL